VIGGHWQEALSAVLLAAVALAVVMGIVDAVHRAPGILETFLNRWSWL